MNIHTLTLVPSAGDLTSEGWGSAVQQHGSTTLPWPTYTSVSPVAPRPVQAAFRIADDPLRGLPHYWAFKAILLQAVLQDTAMLLKANHEQPPKQAPS